MTLTHIHKTDRHNIKDHYAIMKGNHGDDGVRTHS